MTAKQPQRYSSAYFENCPQEEERLFTRIVRQSALARDTDYEIVKDCEPMYSSFAPDRVFKVEQRTFNGKKISKKNPVTFQTDYDDEDKDKVVFHPFGDMHMKTHTTAHSFR